MKKIEMPENIHSERSHRVTCLATYEGEVWGGCRSGFIFCYYNEEEQDGEEEKRAREGGKLVFCHETQIGEGGGVNAMVVDRGGLVWAGGENGWLSVWKSVDGRIAGEEVKFRVPLLHKSRKKLREKKGNQVQESFLELEFGKVGWKRLSSFLKRGERETMLLRDVEEVKEVEGKLGGMGFVLVDKGGREREFEMNVEEGRKALELLKLALFCLREKRVLKRVGEHDLKRRVMALEIAGGRVWSYDGSSKVYFIFLFCFVYLFV